MEGRKKKGFVIGMIEWIKFEKNKVVSSGIPAYKISMTYLKSNTVYT